MAAICNQGCERASACTGACQPTPRHRLKPCRFCAQGYEVHDGEHWIVTSLRKPTITIRRCTAVERAA